MNIVEKSSKNIAELISKEMNHNQDEKEVIEYGAFVVIHTIFCTSLSLLVAYILGLFLPTAVLFLVVGILRTFSGGAHCTSPSRCAVTGALIFITLSYILSILNKIMSFYIYEFYILACVLLALLMIIKYCPIDSENKPIRRRETKERLRKQSFITVGIFTILMITIEFLGSNKNISHIVNLSISTGVLCQSFMLTPKGHKFISFMDKTLSIIFK